ncbi:MAG: ABC transporter ATP-binding protein [Candidatus Freyarchaeota archaeon]|nr:ABC transporter ATP-binding protein [Candidatus Jordarchaeia archaeon]
MVAMPAEDFYEEAFFTGRMIAQAVRWCLEREGNVIDVTLQGIWRKSGEPFKGTGRLLDVYSHPLKKCLVVMLESGVLGSKRFERGSVVTVGGTRTRCDVQALNIIFRNRLRKSTLQLRFFDGNRLGSAVRWIRKSLPLRKVYGRVEGVWLRGGADFVGEGEIVAAEDNLLRKFFVMLLDKGLIGGREIKGAIVSVGSSPSLRYRLELPVRIFLSLIDLYLRRMLKEACLLSRRCGLGVILDSRGATRIREAASNLMRNSVSPLLRRSENSAGVDVAASKVLLEPKHEVALPDEYILRVRGLTVSYGKKVVLRDVSFSLKEGEILGIVGESGSGKTTCMKALIGELPPDSGEILIYGFPPSKKDVVAPLIGYVPQDLSKMYETFTPIENIVYFGRQYGISEDELIKRGKRILKELEIFHKGNEKVETLSGGEKRRVSIAIALVHHPKILFLDEPTSGLDLVRRHELWSYLEKINRTYGTTLVVITHYPSEADYCDKVAVFVKDRGFVDFGTPRELISKLPGGGYAIGIVLEEDDPRAEEVIRSTEGVRHTFRIGPYYKVIVEDEDNRVALKRILSRLSLMGINVYKVEPRVELTFEDYFRYITGVGYDVHDR